MRFIQRVFSAKIATPCPTPTQIRRVDQRPLQEAISTRGRSFIPGLTQGRPDQVFLRRQRVDLDHRARADHALALQPEHRLQSRAGLLRPELPQPAASIARPGSNSSTSSRRKPATSTTSASTWPTRAWQEFKQLLAQGKAQGKTEDQAWPMPMRRWRPSTTTRASSAGSTARLTDIVSTLGDTATATRDRRSRSSRTRRRRSSSISTPASTTSPTR